MTPTSAPDLPDIDKVLQMTKDMELISDFLTNGRFVGDRVHVSIEHLADCIRNRPQSEASAEALELAEIRERWKSRSWPSIGYFVHGQAYQDIQKLLEIIDEK